jgi:hypothetical protein
VTESAVANKVRRPSSDQPLRQQGGELFPWPQGRGGTPKRSARDREPQRPVRRNLRRHPAASLARHQFCARPLLVTSFPEAPAPPRTRGRARLPVRAQRSRRSSARSSAATPPRRPPPWSSTVQSAVCVLRATTRTTCASDSYEEDRPLTLREHHRHVLSGGRHACGAA